MKEYLSKNKVATREVFQAPANLKLSDPKYIMGLIGKKNKKSLNPNRSSIISIISLVSVFVAV